MAIKLDEFIRETIREIAVGVIEGRDAVQQHGVIVGWRSENKVAQLKFDVALTSTDETGAKGGIGVFLGSVGIGGQATSNQGFSSMTRVQFEVPIYLPAKEMRQPIKMPGRG